MNRNLAVCGCRVFRRLLKLSYYYVLEYIHIAVYINDVALGIGGS